MLYLYIYTLHKTRSRRVCSFFVPGEKPPGTGFNVIFGKFLPGRTGYLSPAPQAEPHADGFSSGLSAAPQALPHADGFSSGLSSAPQAVPHAAGFSPGFPAAPQAVPHAAAGSASAFFLQPKRSESAILIYLHFSVVKRFSVCSFIATCIVTNKKYALFYYLVTGK